MDKFKIWDVVSYAWTEVGLEDEDYFKHAKEIYAECSEWKKVSTVITRDVCGSFALDTFLIFPCMLWMIMPDWGYDKEYVERRMEKWYLRSYWVHFLNPIRILGYPTAILFSLSVRKKLKKAFMQCAKNT